MLNYLWCFFQYNFLLGNFQQERFLQSVIIFQKFPEKPCGKIRQVLEFITLATHALPGGYVATVCRIMSRSEALPMMYDNRHQLILCRGRRAGQTRTGFGWIDTSTEWGQVQHLVKLNMSWYLAPTVPSTPPVERQKNRNIMGATTINDMYATRDMWNSIVVLRDLEWVSCCLTVLQ